MPRVRVSFYGAIPAGDPRLWPAPYSAPGKTCLVHWTLCAPLRALSAAAPGDEPLVVQSGWREHRWPSRGQYERTLVRKYQHRTDLACKRGRRPSDCPCMPHRRRACIYLAFASPHETGLAVDFGSLGLYPTTRTIAAQKKTLIYQWLREHAGDFGFRPYKPEPWHWERPIAKDLWLATPEAIGG